MRSCWPFRLVRPAIIGATKVNWLAAGLACWIAVPLITVFRALL